MQKTNEVLGHEAIYLLQSRSKEIAYNIYILFLAHIMLMQILLFNILYIFIYSYIVFSFIYVQRERIKLFVSNSRRLIFVKFTIDVLHSHQLPFTQFQILFAMIHETATKRISALLRQKSRQYLALAVYCTKKIIKLTSRIISDISRESKFVPQARYTKLIKRTRKLTRIPFRLEAKLISSYAISRT